VLITASLKTIADRFPSAFRAPSHQRILVHLPTFSAVPDDQDRYSEAGMALRKTLRYDARVSSACKPSWLEIGPG